jgi:hypothetical protein
MIDFKTGLHKSVKVVEFKNCFCLSKAQSFLSTSFIWFNITCAITYKTCSNQLNMKQTTVITESTFLEHFTYLSLYISGCLSFLSLELLFDVN